MVAALAAQPTASVLQACGRRAATKRSSRLWRSDRVTPAAMWAAHGHTTVARGRAHTRMLVIQDTIDRHVTQHPATHGLGPLDCVRQQGVTVHAARAVRSAGVPLGLIHQDGWIRDPDAIGTRQRRRQLATHDKERQRWLTAQAATQQAVPSDGHHGG